MSSSLFSALSGLSAHQQWIDVIGNNIANSNTTGYKSTRATFSSAFAQTLRFGSAPTGNVGGTNPLQVGLGVAFGSIDRSFSQGALTNTGRIFDLAIEGKGFFSLGNAGERFYSRVGTFGLDADRNLVDQRTGYSVLDTVGSPINVDVDGLFPPSKTENMTMQGNLPAVVSGPLAEVLTSNVGLMKGESATVTSGLAGPFAVPPGSTWSLEVAVNEGAPKLVTVTDAGAGQITAAEVAAAIDALEDVNSQVDGAGQVVVNTDRTGATMSLKINAGEPNDLANLINIPTAQVSGSESLDFAADLNTLPGNVVKYAVGDQIDIEGVDTDGSPIQGTFFYGAGNDGTTIQDFVDFIDGLYTDAAVSLNASGQIVVEAQTPGEADLLLTINDDAANVGTTEWSTYGVSVTTDGTAPDTVVTSTEVYDNAGVAHTLTLTFERQPDLSWSAIASIPDGEGTVLVGGEDDPITDIKFDENGAPTGLGSVLSTITLQFTGQNSPQTIDIDLGQDGQLTGLTQFGSQTNAYISSQDGYGDGELSNLSVDMDGTIKGFYTNGQQRDLGTIGIATFSNEEGLFEEGDGLFSESANSGTAMVGAGAQLGAGLVIGGALENSNVDTAEQFVRLIEAQRGFQANARVITTQDEVLNEVVNLI